MENFDEVNAAKFLFLVDIKDLPNNRLSIIIETAVISNTTVNLKIDGKNLGAVKSILPGGVSKRYTINFETYVAYQITNESFATAN